MEVISRNDAILQRRSRYFTGQACARGHVTYRYTKNGGCSDCVNPKFTSVDLVERDAMKRRVKAMKDARTLIRHGFYIHPENLEAFIATALFYARLREPAIQRGDVIAHRGWVSGPNGTQLRQLWIFPEDRKALQAVENEWEQARRDGDAAARAFERAMSTPLK